MSLMELFVSRLLLIVVSLEAVFGEFDSFTDTLGEVLLAVLETCELLLRVEVTTTEPMLRLAVRILGKACSSMTHARMQRIRIR